MAAATSLVARRFVRLSGTLLGVMFFAVCSADLFAVRHYASREPAGLELCFARDVLCRRRMGSGRQPAPERAGRRAELDGLVRPLRGGDCGNLLWSGAGVASGVYTGSPGYTTDAVLGSAADVVGIPGGSFPDTGGRRATHQIQATHRCRLHWCIDDDAHRIPLPADSGRHSGSHPDDGRAQFCCRYALVRRDSAAGGGSDAAGGGASPAAAPGRSLRTKRCKDDPRGRVRGTGPRSFGRKRCGLPILGLWRCK